ncbi:hypothetical protein OAV30_00645 [Candidatus Pelagibacter sp.]|nr:hypothetical protein [Candidatus Pelagibacter sp.]
MSRILRRPMFRGGQVESKDDLKVIDQMGIANLATGGRVGYDGGGEVKDYMEIIDAVRESRPELPEKKGMSTADYLRIASAGMDILGAPSEGTGIGGAIRTAAGPLSKLGTGMAASLDARTAARAELLANEENAITDMASAIMKSRNYRPDKGFNVDRVTQLIQENVTRRQQIDAALESDASLVKYIQDNNIEANTVEDIAAVKKKLENEKEVVMSVLRDILPKNENMTAFLKTPQAQLLFASVIAAEEKRQGMRQNDPNFDTNALIIAINRIGQKDGGLTTGYANGGLTEMMAEETITPKGVEMQEEVVEETSETSAPLTYDELRLRLPPEVSDDVVKLLAASDEALLEFSNISTQQDVNEFNVKYGVELVLPQV